MRQPSPTCVGTASNVFISLPQPTRLRESAHSKTGALSQDRTSSAVIRSPHRANSNARVIFQSNARNRIFYGFSSVGGKAWSKKLAQHVLLHTSVLEQFYNCRV